MQQGRLAVGAGGEVGAVAATAGRWCCIRDQHGIVARPTRTTLTSTASPVMALGYTAGQFDGAVHAAYTGGIVAEQEAELHPTELALRQPLESHMAAGDVVHLVASRIRTRFQ
jgi:hypothetical protein